MIYFKQFKKRALFINAGAARLMHCNQKRQLAKLMWIFVRIKWSVSFFSFTSENVVKNPGNDFLK